MLLFIATKKSNDIKKSPFNIKLMNQYTNGLGKCKLILLKNLIHNNIRYSHFIYQIDFDLKNKFEKDKSTQKEIITLRLQINNGQSFKKEIYINKVINKRHYFLYDFDCYDKLKKISLSDLELSKCFQFNLFKDVICSKDFISENVEVDFLIDSMDNLIDKDNIFSLELLLEILEFYNNKNEGKLLIKYLEDKWDYIYNCKKLNSYYYNILIKLKENFDKDFTNQSFRFYNQNIEILINLLLIYRARHEKEKIQEIFQMKFYWSFISKIIERKLDFYLNLGIELPIGLINKILGQENLTLDNILKLLSFGNSISEILKMIINNFNILYKTFKRNNYIIIMHYFQDKEYIDDIKELINNIKELIKKELEYNYFFVSFDEEFWLYYINYYIKDFKKLKIIENTILSYGKILCSNLDVKNLSYIIHENEIEFVKKQGLKNEKILYFFEKNYFKGNNNISNIKFPFYFFDEINLETADEKFFTKWKEMNMISYIYYDRYNFINIMLNKITKIEDFGKIFKLFKNNKTKSVEIIKDYLIIQPNILSSLLKNDIIVNLMNKFNELMEDYNMNKCNNFIYDSCFLTYLIDLYKEDSVNFLDTVILKKIDSDEIKKNICFNLLSSSYLSFNLISYIIIYCLLNMNILNDKIEELIIRKLNDKKYIPVIKLLFEYLSSLIINKESLFSEEENIEFFVLLQKVQTLINYKKIDLSRYINKIINFKDQIINDLKNGNIKYDLIHSWLTDNAKKTLLIERLNILSFYNTKEINDCFKSLENVFNQINKNIKKVERLKAILEVFFPIEQQPNIEYLNDYENKLKDKLLKEANKKLDISDFINDLDLDEMDKLKSSKIFLSILNMKKGEKLENNGIEAFKCAQKEYNKLRELFNINWEAHIIEIIEKYPIKKLSENEIEKELFILKNYFGLTNINESEIIKRKNRLTFIIKKKEEIISILTNTFNFILEFATQNIINDLNKLKDIITKNINLAMINKYNNNNLIEQYFINHNNYSFKNIQNNKENQLIQELKAEKEKNKILIDQIQELKNSQNNFNQQISYAINDSRRFRVLKPGEKVISIIVQTFDQNINRSFACKNTDIFVDLEKELYDEYIEYKDIETILICDGRKVSRFKTLEENGIRNSSTIFINKIDNYNTKILNK